MLCFESLALCVDGSDVTGDYILSDMFSDSRVLQHLKKVAARVFQVIWFVYGSTGGYVSPGTYPLLLNVPLWHCRMNHSY